MKIIVKKADLRFRPYRSSGPGGQHRNTTMSAMEVTHLPTGLKACASLKSQYQSKKAALKVLVARIYSFYERPKERGCVTERIRTYHGPDNRVIDHASGFRQTYAEVVGKGDIGKMIEARCRYMIENPNTDSVMDIDG